MTHINTVLVHFRADTSECTRKGGTNWVAMHKLSPIPPFFQTSLSQSAAIYLAPAKILRVGGRHKEHFSDICICFPAFILRNKQLRHLL